jgi:hypothetical protein
MRAAILQPTYLPWMGYFEMISRSEVYVCFDHVQFAHKSWQHRNRIKGPNGELMLTVPVVSDGTQDVRIRDKRIDYRQPWPRKHLKSIEVAYRKAPHFPVYYEVIASILLAEHGSIADLNLAFIVWALRTLGYQARIIRSSELDLGDETQLDKTDRVLNLCRRVGVTTLNDGAAAEAFLDGDRLAAAGIELDLQRFEHPCYPQQFAGFLSYMSIVDLLMNCGEDAASIIGSGRR